MLRMIITPGKSSASLGMSVSDPWRDMVSCKSQVSKLKNWIPKHSKKIIKMKNKKAKCQGRAQSWWRPLQV